MKISEAFNLGKTQAQLDFVDVDLARDAPLFIDPFAISQRLDSLSQECHLTLEAFFQRFVDSIRAGQPDDARALLLRLREPNETRLGYSTRRPQGAGIGTMQAGQLFAALQSSTAVQTGFLKSLEEWCRDTFRDDRGLMLPLEDETVLRWLDLVRQSKRQLLDREISNLVAEVWLN